jgi:hypothetical protein
VLALLSGCVYSQSTTGTLLGIVADPSDAPVPGVQLELKNAATGVLVTTQSNA